MTSGLDRIPGREWWIQRTIELKDAATEALESDLDPIEREFAESIKLLSERYLERMSKEGYK